MNQTKETQKTKNKKSMEKIRRTAPIALLLLLVAGATLAVAFPSQVGTVASNIGLKRGHAMTSLGKKMEHPASDSTQWQKHSFSGNRIIRATNAKVTTNASCGLEGERVNRNPFGGDTTKKCCLGLDELKVSRSYSICVDGLNKTKEVNVNVTERIEELKVKIPATYAEAEEIVKGAQESATSKRFLLWTHDGIHVLWGTFGNGYFAGEDNEGKDVWGVYNGRIFVGFYDGELFDGRYVRGRWKAHNLFGEEYSHGRYETFPRKMGFAKGQVKE